MNTPSGIDRTQLEAMIVGTLGIHAQDFEVAALVDEFEEMWGLVSVEHPPADDYWRLVRKHAKTATD